MVILSLEDDVPVDEMQCIPLNTRLFQHCYLRSRPHSEDVTVGYTSGKRGNCFSPHWLIDLTVPVQEGTIC